MTTTTDYTSLEAYEAFLTSKAPSVEEIGFEVSRDKLNSRLFEWQKDIVQWALKKGRAALFMECGLGKGPLQLEWSFHCSEYTDKPALIVAPLAVAKQMLREGNKFGYWCHYARNQEEADIVRADVVFFAIFHIAICAIFKHHYKPVEFGYRNYFPIIVTNYEMLSRFDPSKFGSLSIDESSILKNYTGARKRQIFAFRESIPFLLAPTATPAPNDHMELGNHAEFLNAMDSSEMLARFFVNDSTDTGKYRLKGHAADSFWRWIAQQWAVCVSKPSDLGYSNDGFVLPPLDIREHTVKVDHTRAHAQGRLFIDAKLSSTNMWAEKRATEYDRCKYAADLVASEPQESWIVWYDTEQEAALLHQMMPDSILVMGKHSIQIKEERLNAFSDGLARVIITHRKIAGLGLNWQHCARMVMFGTYSFEGVYQALRRSWRYGQTRPVVAHMVAAETEYGLLETLRTKQAAYDEMQTAMNKAMKEVGLGSTGESLALAPYESAVADGENHTLFLGDCVRVLQTLPSESVDAAIDSPPFEGLYIYSPHIADMGNSADPQEFGEHYAFMLAQLNRVLKVGAKHALHCKDLPLYQNRDDAMGLRDFPGDLIRAHERFGFQLVEWLTVWKDPVIEMQRTKNAGLLWSSAFCERAERARQGMADYVLVFEKLAPDQKAKRMARHKPLPQSVIARCVDLWSNREDRIILSSAPDSEIRQAGLIIWDEPTTNYTPQWVESYLLPNLMDGRNLVTHVCDARQMAPLIALMSGYKMVFHSRVALTDGTWLVVFRKWLAVADMPEDTHVTHELQAPYFRKPTAVQRQNEDSAWVEMVVGMPGRKNPNGHQFIGNQPPEHYDSDRDYSIQVWQRYASPVWFDLDGLPENHPNILMDINQTDVLNSRIAREAEDEKHICPLQLDLIEEMLNRTSKRGDTVLSTFAGVGSEGYVSVKNGRKFIGAELKYAYWTHAKRFLQEAEHSAGQIDLFQWAGIEVA